MKKIFTKGCLSLFVLFVVSLGLQAQSTSLTLDLATAETLGEQLGANKYTVQNLTLKGKIGGADVDVIRDIVNNGALTELNLSAVTIVGGTSYKDKFSNVWQTAEDEITDNMFHQLPKLTAIVLPKNITKIRDRAFNNVGIKSIVIPGKVTELGNSAIAQCQLLEVVTIPASVTMLGSNAFYYSPMLKEIHCLGSTPATLANSSVFGQIDLSICTLYVPYGAANTYKGKTIWKNFTNIVEEGPVKPETLVKTVNVTPAGSLPSLLSADEMINVTDLIVTGDLNGTDIKAIRAMENLFVLDIQMQK